MEVGDTAWFPLLCHIVPSAIRGRYFGSMRRAWQVTSLVAVFLCAAVLGDEPGYGRFLLVLAPAILLQAGRVWFYSRLPDPPPADPSAPRYEWRDILVPLRDPAFVQYATVPFVVPFLRQELAFPASTTLYSSGGFGLGSALTLTAVAAGLPLVLIWLRWLPRQGEPPLWHRRG